MLRRVCLREWQRFSQTPRLWFLTLLAPLLLAALVLWIFAQRTPLSLPLLLADYDHSATSRDLGRQLQALPSLQVITLPPDLHAAARIIRQGKAYGLLVVPPDFERELARGDAPTLTLYYNRQALTVGNRMMTDVRTLATTLGARINLEQGRAPAVLTDIHPAFNPGMDYGRFLALPLILTLLHIAITLVAVDVTGRELREHTAADWLASADGHILPALIGKLLPYGLWFSAFGLVFLLTAMRLLGIAFNGAPLLWFLGWMTLVLACLGLGALMVVLTGNLRMALSLASVTISPAFAFAGLSFPAAFMPGFAEFWSALLPLTHGLAIHVQQALIGAPLDVSLKHLAALLVFILLPLLPLQRWRRLMTDPACWGAR